MNNAYLGMVHDCEKKEDLLTRNEVIFVGGLGDNLEMGKDLDREEAARLETIWWKTGPTPTEKINLKIKLAARGLVLTRERMESSAIFLEEIDSHESRRHAKELRGAMKKVQTWIDGLNGKL